jgi:hypothetical protein
MSLPGDKYGLDYQSKHKILNLPQYQITCFTPLLDRSAYTAGNVGYRLCAGKLIEPRMVPPYPIMLVSIWQVSPFQLQDRPLGQVNVRRYTLHTSKSVRRTSTSTKSFPAFFPSRNHSSNSWRGNEATTDFGFGYAACQGTSLGVFSAIFGF